MHPIERLRYVARASGAGQELLVQETASALGAFDGDPMGMVTACRRIVGRHPGSGPLWWLCGRVLTTTDPMREAWAAADEIDADPTPKHLAHHLPGDVAVCVVGWPELVAAGLVRRGDLEVRHVDPQGDGIGLARVLLESDVDVVDVPPAGIGQAVATADLVVLEASVMGPEAFLAPAGSLAMAAVARQSGVDVWLTAGVGRLVPRRVWEAVVRPFETADDPWEADAEVVALDLVDRVVDPCGLETVADALRRTDCPVAPELFKEL